MKIIGSNRSEQLKKLCVSSKNAKISDIVMSDGDDMFIIKNTSLSYIDKTIYKPIGIIAVEQTEYTQCAMVALKYAHYKDGGSMFPVGIVVGQNDSLIFENQSLYNGKKLSSVWEECVNEQTNFMNEELVANSNTGYSPAVCACIKYSTPGTKHHNWYLPSIAELKSYADNISKIRKSAFLIRQHYCNNTSITHNIKLDANGLITHTKYLSSNEIDKFFVVGIDAILNKMCGIMKTERGIVLPFCNVYTPPTNNGLYVVRKDMKLVLPTDINKDTPNEYVGVAIVTNKTNVIVSKNDIKSFKHDASGQCFKKLSATSLSHSEYIHTLGSPSSTNKCVSFELEEWNSGALSHTDGYCTTNKTTLSKYACKYGEQYVPSMCELAIMKIYLNELNDILKLIDGSPLETSEYMSSTSYNTMYYWCLDMNTGLTNIKKNDTRMNVRMCIHLK